jgi:hypothetical protein
MPDTAIAPCVTLPNQNGCGKNGRLKGFLRFEFIEIAAININIEIAMHPSC